ncbi:hypothetical protein ACIRO1_35050 [Streptomyces sp. NPDC102381]
MYLNHAEVQGAHAGVEGQVADFCGGHVLLGLGKASSRALLGMIDSLLRG